MMVMVMMMMMMMMMMVTDSSVNDGLYDCNVVNDSAQ